MTLISVDSGVTLAISMRRMLADRQWPMRLFLPSVPDDAGSGELQQILRAHPPLRVITAVSHPDGVAGGRGALRCRSRHAVSCAGAASCLWRCGRYGAGANAAAGLPAEPWYQEHFGEAVRSGNRTYRLVQIRINGNAFRGNNQASVPLQAESAGVRMACSCRAGVYGNGKVLLNAVRLNSLGAGEATTGLLCDTAGG
ncbi:hypothetical protein AAGU66_06090 [Edwardsiella ictaluri]|uniref:hypothetical protein n=2 Tax=Edwardsiella ictaluri TaxID=67780 RepID=UPI000670A117|nr:hypothetical protein [Edwardsiella ictaluri]ELV7526379.1 hypothetical protein [Edwardsiella ictaluri]UYB62852.1 hypothetical protein N8I66_06705 [Edwardsiella ictaluri]UYB66078.1 hypothetical protein N8I67_06700 [Edwardsiella ictaluri]WJH20764.1 hypothetical protein FGU63_06730 [Edwardsiella ictaluri]